MTRSASWTTEGGGTWTKTLPGRPGETSLLLRVTPDPDYPKEPWIWALMQADPENEEIEYELDLGGGASREEAMAAVTARALAYLEGED